MAKSDEPVHTPSLGASVADTHAHLTMLDDPARALVRAAEAGVSFIATIADLSEDDDATLERLDAWCADAVDRCPEGAVLPVVRIIAGTHPHNASRWTPALEARLREVLADPRVAAIGEVGLDYHYDHSPREVQRRMFETHIALAHEHALPVVVHLREAHDEGLAMLRDAGVPAAGCIVHCFTEGPAIAAAVLELGCSIAFGGAMTFNKADAIREAAALVPLDRLLVETDCPFMTPVPLRGRTNEPAWVTFVAERLAQVKGLPTAEVAAATTENALRILGAMR